MKVYDYQAISLPISLEVMANCENVESIICDRLKICTCKTLVLSEGDIKNVDSSVYTSHISEDILERKIGKEMVCEIFNMRECTLVVCC